MSSLPCFDGAVSALERAGLNWLAYAAWDEGPPSAGFDANQGLLLALSLGPAFAEQTQYTAAAVPNPFDQRAIELLTPFVEVHLKPWDARAQLVYPQASHNVNLRSWLTAAGAHYPSRLGIGLRPDCGTWFAVRGAVATDLPTALRRRLAELYPRLPAGDSPCKTCAGTPCARACPARAIADDFEFERCGTERLRSDSSCALTCAARLACPIGHDHRYSTGQIAYHYGVSLSMLRRWKNT